MEGENPISWNNDFAYGLGLFTADGRLSQDGRHLDFTSKEIEQIENFKCAWNLDNKISQKRSGYLPNKKYFRVQFSKVTLYKSLLAIGLSPRKSLSIKQLIIPDKYFSDFLRGYLDGDGSISFNRHPESNLQQIKLRFSSGSNEFLIWLKDRINTLSMVNGGFILKSKGAYQLVFCKRDAIHILTSIYKSSSISLTRKKERSLFFLKQSIGFLANRWKNRYTTY